MLWIVAAGLFSVCVLFKAEQIWHSGVLCWRAGPQWEGTGLGGFATIGLLHPRPPICPSEAYHIFWSMSFSISQGLGWPNFGICSCILLHHCGTTSGVGLPSPLLCIVNSLDVCPLNIQRTIHSTKCNNGFQQNRNHTQTQTICLDYCSLTSIHSQSRHIQTDTLNSSLIVQGNQNWLKRPSFLNAVYLTELRCILR